MLDGRLGSNRRHPAREGGLRERGGKRLQYLSSTALTTNDRAPLSGQGNRKTKTERKVAEKKLIRNSIHEDGGPLIYNGLGRRAALLRPHLPQVLPLPPSNPSAEPQLTHRFPRRAHFHVQVIPRFPGRTRVLDLVPNLGLGRVARMVEACGNARVLEERKGHWRFRA